MGDVADVQTDETPADIGTDPAAVAKRWVSELTLAEKELKPFWERSRKVIKRYEDTQNEASEDVKARRYALLWSNMETLEPAVYARLPSAVVSRRWKDGDPIGRIASEALERSLNFSLDTTDFAGSFDDLTKEFLLVARGVPWVRYVPHMKTVTPPPVPNAVNDQAQGESPPAAPPTGGVPDGEGGEQQDAADGQIADGAEPYDVVDWEEAIPDHVAYDDFLHNPARYWSEVRWVARRAYMTRDELRTRFGKDIGDKVDLDHKPEDAEAADDDQWAKAMVFEIWDKVSRKVIWIAKGYQDGPLDERDDPLGLKDFFPCPKPAQGTTSPRSIIPIADYNYYKAQDKDIDTLTVRIGLLEDALKVRGFYAAGNGQKDNLADLLTGETNTMIPVDGWAAFKESGGIEGMVAWLPVEIVATTLKACIDARQQLIQDVYQITGIADIMRGDVDPNETATATRTKSTWGSSRVRRKQKEIARVARETIAIMGQVIASKFAPQTLAGMSNLQLFFTQEEKMLAGKQLLAQAQAWQMQQQAQQAQQPPPALTAGPPGAAPPQLGHNGGPPMPPPGAPAAAPPQPFKPDPKLLQKLQDPTWDDVTALLRDNVMRTFRLDIETDSTIEPNDQDEKQRRVEFLQAVGEFVSKSVPAIQLMPQMLPVFAQALLFLIRGFRVGREMEDVIEKAMDQLQASANNPQPAQQAPQGPSPQVEAMKGQAALMDAHAKLSDAQTNQFRAQTDRQEAQVGAQLDQQRIAHEAQQGQLDRLNDQHMQGQDIAADLRQSVVKGVERQFIHGMNDPHHPKIDTP